MCSSLNCELTWKTISLCGQTHLDLRIAIISHSIREVVVSDTNSRQFSSSIMGKLWLEHHFLLLGGPSTSTSIPVPSL